MGRLKALLPWHGTTLLAHQITVLRQAGIGKVVVVLGYLADSLKPIVQDLEGVTWTVNPDYEQGKTTSIKAALNALDQDELNDILILNVDQPRSAATISDLLRRPPGSGAIDYNPYLSGKGRASDHC